MNGYGRSAVEAVGLITTGIDTSPRSAWERATSDIFGAGDLQPGQRLSTRRLPGPCQEGLVRRGSPRASILAPKGTVAMPCALLPRCGETRPSCIRWTGSGT